MQPSNAGDFPDFDANFLTSGMFSFLLVLSSKFYVISLILTQIPYLQCFLIIGAQILQITFSAVFLGLRVPCGYMSTSGI